MENLAKKLNLQHISSINNLQIVNFHETKTLRFSKGGDLTGDLYHAQLQIYENVSACKELLLTAIDGTKEKGILPKAELKPASLEMLS